MKTYLIALISFLIAPVLAFAALDVTLSESSVVSVGGYSLVVSGSANVDSILVDTSSFSVVLSSGASLTVTSADRKAFTVSPSFLNHLADLQRYAIFGDSRTGIGTGDHGNGNSQLVQLHPF